MVARRRTGVPQRAAVSVQQPIGPSPLPTRGPAAAEGQTDPGKRTSMATPAAGAGGAARRLATETKQAFKTSEFWAYVLVFILILIAGNSIEGNDGGVDFFNADHVWLYITILTFGYMLSRGLAKSGSRDPYTDRPNAGTEAGGLGDRVKSAATVLREGEPSPGPGGTGEPGPPR